MHVFSSLISVILLCSHQTLIKEADSRGMDTQNRNVIYHLFQHPLPSHSFVLRLMLPEEPPSAPPKNIVASGRTNQSIMVQWQPPPESEHNGLLHGYILR